MTPPAMTPMGECLRRHGSDKAWPHALDMIYSRLFPDRQAALDILEIGLADGQSVRAWQEWFPNARTLGLDKEPCERLTGGRIECHQCEQTDLVGLYHWIGTRQFDWIIEDAAHLWDKQLLTIPMLWPALKPGGYYCLEDVAEKLTGAFSMRKALEAFRGQYHDLNGGAYFDGGQLYVIKKPE